MNKTIKKESELKKWFIDNYPKLGYSKIIRKDIGICPDFIMSKDGKEIRVELETVTSNFLLHKHSFDDVDEIICVKKDIELKKPIIEINELNFKGSTKRKVTLSMEDTVYDAYQKYCKENGLLLSRQVEMMMIKEIGGKKK